MYGSSNATRSSTITQSPLSLRRALLYCLLGVLGFSLTLPATRLASGQIDALILGPGRGAVAGVFAAIWLVWSRAPRPSRRQLRGLTLVALGTVLGFPLLTALALERLPAHRAVIAVGLSPLATSVVAALRNRERLSPTFWLFAALGAGAIVAFGAAQDGGALSLDDGLLLLAVSLVAVGYAEGGRLSTEMDGFAVICWALVLSLPLTSLCVVLSVWQRGMPAPSGLALLSFTYISLVSMLFAFCAWYRGLALGGVARGSQVQLLQPMLSLGWCALILAEPLSSGTLLASTAVLASAAGARLVR